jgi:hypothetical protein
MTVIMIIYETSYFEREPNVRRKKELAQTDPEKNPGVDQTPQRDGEKDQPKH